MKYTIFHNQDAMWFRPGSLDDFYIMGYSGSIIGDGGSLERALEAIFMRHNLDERPDRHTRPAMSVGDVVVLSGPYQYGQPYMFTVDMVGWKEL